MCQVVHHSTYLVRQTCLHYFVLTLREEVITTNETNARYEKNVFVIHGERKIDDIFTCHFLEFPSL